MTHQTSFGFEKVSFQEKASKVRDIFSRVVPRYDLMNDLMSGGLHRCWKKAFVDGIPLFQNAVCLDVAGGTGDIALRLHKKLVTRGGGRVLVYDVTEKMLEKGRDRALDRGVLEGLSWLCGTAESLPFPDNTFDVYTISFGLRNVTSLECTLQEAYRVLKPAGQFFCLEFSKITDPFLKKLYDLYAFNIVPKMGAYVAKDEASYQYLAESIDRFPEQSLLATYLQHAHFSRVAYRNLASGLVAVHSGTKLEAS